VKNNKELLTKGFNKLGLYNEKLMNSSDFLIAYLAHKTTLPLRLTATGLLVPLIRKAIL